MLEDQVDDAVQNAVSVMGNVFPVDKRACLFGSGIRQGGKDPFQIEAVRRIQEEFNFRGHFVLPDFGKRDPDAVVSSIAAVTDKMRSGPCFICEADLYIPSPDLLLRPLDRSGFFARFVPGHSDDWLFDLDDSRRILAFHKGGDDKYNLSGISWFTAPDATKVADIIDAAIRDPANDQCFWDETVCRHASEIDMTIHEVTDADIVECDTMEDLHALEARLQ